MRLVLLFLILSAKLASAQDTLRLFRFGVHEQVFYNVKLNPDRDDYRIFQNSPACFVRLKNHYLYVGYTRYNLLEQEQHHEVLDKYGNGINFGYRYYFTRPSSLIGAYGQLHYTIMNMGYSSFRFGRLQQETGSIRRIESCGIVGADVRPFKNFRVNLGVGVAGEDFFTFMDYLTPSINGGISYNF